MKSLPESFERLAVFLILTLASPLAAYSQQTVPSKENPPISTDESKTTVDRKAHDAAVRLVDAMGIKEEVAEKMDSNVERGVAKMRSELPNLSPEFVNEWRKRMKARLNPDDYVAIVAQVYEKYFTAEELDQLCAVVISKKQGKTAELSDALSEKFQNNEQAIDSEIAKGTTQISARLGSEVGQEIAKEHPEWVPFSAPQSAPTVK